MRGIVLGLTLATVARATSVAKDLILSRLGVLPPAGSRCMLRLATWLLVIETGLDAAAAGMVPLSVLAPVAASKRVVSAWLRCGPPGEAARRALSTAIVLSGQAGLVSLASWAGVAGAPPANTDMVATGLGLIAGVAAVCGIVRHVPPRYGALPPLLGTICYVLTRRFVVARSHVRLWIYFVLLPIVWALRVASVCRGVERRRDAATVNTVMHIILMTLAGTFAFGEVQHERPGAIVLYVVGWLLVGVGLSGIEANDVADAADEFDNAAEFDNADEFGAANIQPTIVVNIVAPPPYRAEPAIAPPVYSESVERGL